MEHIQSGALGTTASPVSRRDSAKSDHRETRALFPSLEEAVALWPEFRVDPASSTDCCLCDAVLPQPEWLHQGQRESCLLFQSGLLCRTGKL